jgi:HSP20 family protein
MKLRDLVPWREETKGLIRLDPVTRLQTEINRLFEGFFPGFASDISSELSERRLAYSPRLDLKESEREIVVRCELPGISEKEIDISLGDDYLTIKGEKRYEEEKTEGEVTYHETSYGRFERVVPLSCAINQEAIDCTLKNGVLRLVLPKKAGVEKGVRKVSVRAA